MYLSRPCEGEDAMVVAVVAKLVSFTNNALDDLWILLGVFPQHEERGANALRFEGIKDLRRRVR